MNATAWNITFDITKADGITETGHTLVVFGFTLTGALQGWETVRNVSLNHTPGVSWDLTAARKLSASEMLDLL
jgi:hypothetical protein